MNEFDDIIKETSKFKLTSLASSFDGVIYFCKQFIILERLEERFTFKFLIN
jgi:hypothetical protein